MPARPAMSFANQPGIMALRQRIFAQEKAEGNIPANAVLGVHVGEMRLVDDDCEVDVPVASRPAVGALSYGVCTPVVHSALCDVTSASVELAQSGASEVATGVAAAGSVSVGCVGVSASVQAKGVGGEYVGGPVPLEAVEPERAWSQKCATRAETWRTYGDLIGSAEALAGSAAIANPVDLAVETGVVSGLSVPTAAKLLAMGEPLRSSSSSREGHLQDARYAASWQYRMLTDPPDPEMEASEAEAERDSALVRDWGFRKLRDKLLPAERLADCAVTDLTDVDGLAGLRAALALAYARVLAMCRPDAAGELALGRYHLSSEAASVASALRESGDGEHLVGHTGVIVLAPGHFRADNAAVGRFGYSRRLRLRVPNACLIAVLRSLAWALRERYHQHVMVQDNSAVRFLVSGRLAPGFTLVPSKFFAGVVDSFESLLAGMFLDHLGARWALPFVGW